MLLLIAVKMMSSEYSYMECTVVEQDGINLGSGAVGQLYVLSIQQRERRYTLWGVIQSTWRQ